MANTTSGIRLVRCVTNTPDLVLHPYSWEDIPSGTAEIRIAAIERYGDQELIVEYVPLDKVASQTE